MATTPSVIAKVVSQYKTQTSMPSGGRMDRVFRSDDEMRAFFEEFAAFCDDVIDNLPCKAGANDRP